jgi:hypothetical protein
MNPSPQAQSAPDARLAGGMINIVQQLQKNRLSGSRQLQGAPIGGESQQGAEVLNALRNNRSDVQKQDATSTPRPLQGKGREEQGRERNVGQRQAQSGSRQSA